MLGSKTDYINSNYKRYGLVPTLQSGTGEVWWDRISAKNITGEEWWNGIILPVDKVPECRNCIADTNAWNKIAHTMTLVQFEGTSIISEGNRSAGKKVKCSRWCLWWNWHHHQRSQLQPHVNR